MSGFGLAGFASGIARGLETAQQLYGMYEHGQIAKVREQGIAEARALQEKATPQVTDNGDMQNLTSRPQASMDPKASTAVDGAAAAIPEFMQRSEQAEAQRQQWNGAAAQSSRNPKMAAPEPESEMSPRAGGFQLTQPKRFTVGNKEFDAEADAKAYAKSQAPAIESFYNETVVPKMRNILIEQGKPEEAARWVKYAEQADAKRTFKDFSRVMLLAEKGDMMGAAEGLIKLYDDYDDGWKVVSSERTTGEDGTPGFTMKIRDEDGNERTMFQTAQTITDQAMWRASPYEMFKARDQRQQKALEAKYKAKTDAENDARTAARLSQGIADRLKGRKELQEDQQEEQRKRDAERQKGRMEALEKRDQQRIAAEARKLASTIKKSDSPEKQYMSARAQVLKNPMSATMKPEEIDAEARQILEQAKAFATDQAPAPAAQPGGTVPNPLAAAPQKGVPVFRNGRIEYVSR